MGVRVLGETYDQPEELLAEIHATERQLANTPETPVQRRSELAERLDVLRAVYRRQRRERLLKRLAAFGVAAAALAVAFAKAPRHAKYAIGVARLLRCAGSRMVERH